MLPSLPFGDIRGIDTAARRNWSLSVKFSSRGNLRTTAYTCGTKDIAHCHTTKSL